MRAEVHRSSDEEDVIAAGDGVVEAAFYVKVGAEDRQGPERQQVLEVGVLRRVILSGRQHKEEDEQWM